MILSHLQPRAGCSFLIVVLLCVLCLLCCPPSTRAHAGAVLFGKVLDQSTGEPLRKVRIVLRESDLQAITGDDGTFRIEGIPAGACTVSVSTIGYRLIKREIQLREGDLQEVVFYLGQEASTVSDVVHVTAPLFEEVEKAAASQITLNSSELKNLAGVLIDDPMRSVQTLPGIAANDDFQSSYSVRGGRFQNNGVVIDGVFTHNLAHTIQGTQEPTGSIMLMNGDLVESMALYTGAFSAKYGDRTASFLDVATREGSRDHVRARMAVSGSNAAFVAEGPLDASHRGSWILSARKSYVDYLVRRLGPENDLTLGFGDVQGKITYELSASQRFGATFVWGNTGLTRNPVNRGVTSLIEGGNKVGVGNVSWSITPNSRLMWESRLYLIRETYENRNKTNEVLDRGNYTELVARSDVSYSAGRKHRLDSGVLVRFIENYVSDRRYDYSLSQFVDFDWARKRYRQTAGYVQDRWTLWEGRLAAIVGVRAETTELTGQTVVNPRASIEWRPGAGQKLEAGWGIFSQFPDMMPVLGRNGDPRLRAEVARHHVVGYERLLGSKARIRVEAYDKEESDLQRSRDNLFRLVNGKVTPPDINFHYDNALRGHTRGFEVMLQRRSANRLAGWVSYGYESSRRQDLVTGETYPNDYEQKHTVNIYGSYRFSEKWNLSVKARFGSGFPYPGYFEASGSACYLSSDRNQERLPYYGRVDLRANKAFYFSRSKFSLYLEILNATNRENLRFDHISGVNAKTRLISFSKDSLLPILPTAGFVLEF
jgi:hypothetical protein